MGNVQGVQVRRGLKKDLITLPLGEFGYCTDTNELFIGSPAGNVKVATDLDVADIKQNIMAGEDGKPISLEAFLRSLNENKANLSVIGATNWDSGNFKVENGTWILDLIGLTTRGTPVYTRRIARYTKIGFIVFCFLDIAISSKGGMSGQLRIDGLPFAATSSIIFPLAMTTSVTGFTRGAKGCIGTGFAGGSMTGMIIREDYTNANLTAESITDNFTIGASSFWYYAS